MNLTVRSVATSLAMGFSVYYVARGLWWIEQPLLPPLLLGALAAYLAMMMTAIFVEDDASGRMPLWAAVLAVPAGTLIPAMASLALAPYARQQPFATWYIGAVGLLGVVCVVRGRPLFGGGVLAVLIVSSMMWMGPVNALRLGLVGSILWMVLAILMMRLWRRAVEDTEALANIQRRVSGWRAIQRVRQSERRRRVQYALEVAGPVLSLVIASGGELTEGERTRARMAEGRLRDELRGADLLDDAVRTAIDGVRRSGGTVTLLDEGGLEGVPEQRRIEIRAALAQALQGAGGLRVIVRAARDPRTAVTVVGRVSGGEPTDEDDVALWREIPREVAAPVETEAH